MAICFKLTVIAVTLFVYSQLDVTYGRPMSYSDLQMVLEPLIQMKKSQPWKAQLQESEAYNMQPPHSKVDAFEIEEGIYM